MNIRIRIAAVFFVLTSSTAIAGGSNPPGPGVQINGSSTTTSGVINAVAGSAITAAGGPSGIARAVSSMPGATTRGDIVTSPPIMMNGNAVTVTVDMVSGAVTVTDASGTVLYSGT